MGPVVLLMLSANHHDLDLTDIERLSARADAVGRQVVAADPAVRGAVVLATCNRFEVYVDAEDQAEALTAAREVVAAAAGTTPDAVGRLMRTAADDDAVAHLFTVAAGLDSMVVGEREITGQVRRALATARAEGTTSPLLERVLQHATRTSRRVAVATDLARAGRSVVAVALDLAGARAAAIACARPGRPTPVSDDGSAGSTGEDPAESPRGAHPVAAHALDSTDPAPPRASWAGHRTLLLGTGSYAGASLAALRERGATDVRVWSASGRAHGFAAAHGIDPAPADLTAAVATADLVVACRGTGTPVLDVPTVAAAAAARAARGEVTPLVVVDLALRRDVDPAVAGLDGVLLVDLPTVREHAPATTAREIARARAIVAAGVRELAEVSAERRMDEAVVALRQAVAEAVAEEIDKLPGGEVPADRAARALRRLAARLLHEPTVRARAAGRLGHAEEHLRAMVQVLGVGAPTVASGRPAAVADPDDPALAVDPDDPALAVDPGDPALAVGPVPSHRAAAARE